MIVKANLHQNPDFIGHTQSRTIHDLYTDKNNEMGLKSAENVTSDQTKKVVKKLGTHRFRNYCIHRKVYNLYINERFDPSALSQYDVTGPAAKLGLILLLISLGIGLFFTILLEMGALQLTLPGNED